jgi:hypothetical protein
MKTIEPIQIWINGKIITATIFQLNCTYDNLLNCAVFNYFLFDSNNIQVYNDFLTMSLPDYETDWTTNNSAYLWAATQLGLTITGEYNPA